MILSMRYIEMNPVRARMVDYPAETDPDSGALELLRQSLQSGTPLGDDQFQARIEAVVGQKVGLIGPGRPRKKPAGGRID